ncbi:MAG: chromate resistance protein [Candidatus Omnitrophica bacterium]|nr:chromate resistance protein [Candidatus Omnitrophota bacterium]
MIYSKKSKLIIPVLVGIIGLLFLPTVVFGQTKASVYSTWDTLEVDTCATAWLIKNFVDKNAIFKFYPKGEIISEGIAFDTPDAEFRRTAEFCAFETVINKYKISDDGVKEIGKLIHEIEINYWAQEPNSKIVEFKQEVAAVLQASTSSEQGFEKTFLMFDKLYADLSLKFK